MNTKQITVNDNRRGESFVIEVPTSATRADIKAKVAAEMWKRYGEEVEFEEAEEETREDAIARMKQSRGKK